MKSLNCLENYRLRERERQMYGMNGDEYNGVFKVFVSGKSFFVIASRGAGWEHVSVSPATSRKSGTPTWSEMCAIKDMFFEPEECVIEFHPPKSSYVNNCENCLHLWRPIDTEIPAPPTWCV